MNDRPLTDAQERALIKLCELTDNAQDNRAMPIQTRFDTRRICKNVTTAFVLDRLGLATVRGGITLGRYEASITVSGRAMLASMGD